MEVYPWFIGIVCSLRHIDFRFGVAKRQRLNFILTLSLAMETSGRIWPNFELIQAFIHVLITCKYDKDPIKNSGENVMTSVSPL